MRSDVADRDGEPGARVLGGAAPVRARRAARRPVLERVAERLAQADAAGRRRPGEPGAVSRLLGIDLGERRIGLAIADRMTAGPAAGHDPARAAHRRATWPTLDRVIGEQDIGELVVGLPLEASGADGPQARLTRTWAEAVARDARAARWRTVTSA